MYIHITFLSTVTDLTRDYGYDNGYDTEDPEDGDTDDGDIPDQTAISEACKRAAVREWLAKHSHKDLLGSLMRFA
jgi:hypothetical protein